MLTARRAWAVAGVTATVGAATAAALLFAPPAVSVSSLTIPGGDSVALVVAWTRRCTAGVCPAQWDVEVVRRSPEGRVQEVRRARTTLKDTVRVARSICWDRTRPQTVDTMLVRVTAMPVGPVEQSNVGRGKLAVRCRWATMQEQVEAVALNDSFPVADRRIVVSDWAYLLPKAQRDPWRVEELRAAKTAGDSLRLRQQFAVLDTTRADSLRVTGDTLPLGYAASLCLLGRNRYTSAVAVLGGNVQSCDAPRQRVASARSG